MKTFYFSVLSLLATLGSLSAMEQPMPGSYNFQEPMSGYGPFPPGNPYARNPYARNPYARNPYARNPSRKKHVQKAPNRRGHPINHRLQGGYPMNPYPNQQSMYPQNMQNGYPMNPYPNQQSVYPQNMQNGYPMNPYPNQQSVYPQSTQQEIALAANNLDDMRDLLYFRSLYFPSNSHLTCDEQTAERLHRSQDNSPDIIQWRIDCRAYLAARHALNALAIETNTPIPQNPNQTGSGGFIDGVEDIVEAPIKAVGDVAQGVLNAGEGVAENVWDGLKKIF